MILENLSPEAQAVNLPAGAMEDVLTGRRGTAFAMEPYGVLVLR